jgi:hypothetical protein
MDLAGGKGRPPDTRTRLIHSRKYLAGSQDIGGLGGVSLGLYRVIKDGYCWLGAETFSKGPANTVQVNFTQFPVVGVRVCATPLASPDFAIQAGFVLVSHRDGEFPRHPTKLLLLDQAALH